MIPAAHYIRCITASSLGLAVEAAAADADAAFPERPAVDVGAPVREFDRKEDRNFTRHESSSRPKNEVFGARANDESVLLLLASLSPLPRRSPDSTTSEPLRGIMPLASAPWDPAAPVGC